MGEVIKTIGNIAKFALPFIPGIGIPARLALGAASGLASGGNVESALGGAAMGGIGGLADKTGLLQKLGTFAKQPGMLGNTAGTGLDLGKMLGLGMGAANVIGANKQRKANTAFTNSQIDQRNALMSKIMSGMQNQYNFAPENFSPVGR